MAGDAPEVTVEVSVSSRCRGGAVGGVVGSALVLRFVFTPSLCQSLAQSTRGTRLMRNACACGRHRVLQARKRFGVMALLHDARGLWCCAGAR